MVLITQSHIFLSSVLVFCRQLNQGHLITWCGDKTDAGETHFTAAYCWNYDILINFRMISHIFSRHNGQLRLGWGRDLEISAELRDAKVAGTCIKGRTSNSRLLWQLGEWRALIVVQSEMDCTPNVSQSLRNAIKVPQVQWLWTISNDLKLAIFRFCYPLLSATPPLLPTLQQCASNKDDPISHYWWWLQSMNTWPQCCGMKMIIVLSFYELYLCNDFQTVC